MTIDPDVEALLKQAMRRRGEPFKRVLNDALREGPAKASKPFRQLTFRIAAIALANCLTLATRNVRDFEAIDGLSVSNPWSDTTGKAGGLSGVAR